MRGGRGRECELLGGEGIPLSEMGSRSKATVGGPSQQQEFVDPRGENLYRPLNRRAMGPKRPGEPMAPSTSSSSSEVVIVRGPLGPSTSYSSFPIAGAMVAVRDDEDLSSSATAGGTKCITELPNATAFPEGVSGLGDLAQPPLPRRVFFEGRLGPRCHSLAMEAYEDLRAQRKKR